MEGAHSTPAGATPVAADAPTPIVPDAPAPASDLLLLHLL